MMKKVKILFLVVMALSSMLLYTGCSKNYLDKQPTSSISPSSLPATGRIGEKFVQTTWTFPDQALTPICYTTLLEQTMAAQAGKVYIPPFPIVIMGLNIIPK